MKTIYFKETTDGNSLPHIELSQPVKPGRPRFGLAIYKINNVPDEMDWRDVKRIFEGTAVVSSDKVEFDFSELGMGKIIMPKPKDLRSEMHIEENPDHGVMPNGIKKTLVIWDNGESFIHYFAGSLTLEESCQEMIALMQGRGKGINITDTYVLNKMKNRQWFEAICGTEKFRYDRHANH
ncbi:MAG TPA: hypothetical protein PKE03_10260 [Bacteroidales bacterium]|nr:hypothetical protein [Bacteroidales bacterium]